ncbi:hypothetical protein D9M68_938160 [compost metagenome]
MQQQFVELLDQLEQQRFLTFYVVVDRAGPDAQVPGQVAHADSAEAATGKQGQGLEAGVLIARVAADADRFPALGGWRS